MKLVSMKHTPSEMKEDQAEMAVSSAPEEYPWELRLRLDNDELEKLGLADIDSFEIGQVLRIEAAGHVCAKSESESDSGGKRIYLEVQITDMAMASAKAKKSVGDSLYGDA